MSNHLDRPLIRLSPELHHTPQALLEHFPPMRERLAAQMRRSAEGPCSRDRPDGFVRRAGRHDENHEARSEARGVRRRARKASACFRKTSTRGRESTRCSESHTTRCPGGGSRQRGMRPLRHRRADQEGSARVCLPSLHDACDWARRSKCLTCAARYLPATRLRISRRR